MTKLFTALFLIGMFVQPSQADAKQVIEKSDRMEVNWSTLRIRFYGEAEADLQSDDDYKFAEKKAWRDGLRYVSGAVRDIYIAQNEMLFGNPDLLSKAANKAAKSISTSTFSYDTTYYANGTIRVHLENMLSKAIASDAIRFRLKEALDPGLIQHSGVLFELDNKIKPSATYKVIDENGETLFDAKEMAESAFKKNLMGRWFIAPHSSELEASIGNVPVRIPVKLMDNSTVNSAGNSTFVVKRKYWDRVIEGHKALLRSGRIALSMPM